MSSKEASAICSVLFPAYIERDLSLAKERACIASNDISASSGRDYLLEFCLYERLEALEELARFALRNRILDAEHHVTLVAALFGSNLLSHREAASLLSQEGRVVRCVSPEAQRAIDVAWLVRQDLDGGYIDADQDTLLADALKNVFNSSGAKSSHS